MEVIVAQAPQQSASPDPPTIEDLTDDEQEGLTGPDENGDFTCNVCGHVYDGNAQCQHNHAINPPEEDPDMYTCGRCGQTFRMGPQCDCWSWWNDEEMK